MLSYDEMMGKSSTKSSRKSRKLQSNVIYNRAYAYTLPSNLSNHISFVLDIIDMPLPEMPGPVISSGTVKNRDDIIEMTTTEEEYINSFIPNFKESLRKVTADQLTGNPKSRKLTATTQTVTPSNLRSVYGISGYGSKMMTQAVYGNMGQSYLSSDITYFQNKYNLLKSNVKNSMPVPSNSTCINNPANCVEASLDLQYILAVSGNVSTSYWYDENDYSSFLVSVFNSTDPPLVISISYGTYEMYTPNSVLSTFNTEAIKLGLRGVTIVVASGDDGVTGYLWESTSFDINTCGYYAMFPASSPFVTTIGGTMGGMETTGSKSPEVACQSSAGASITTGGSFSQNFSALSFMTTAQNKYFSTVSTAITQSPYQMYIQGNRGYPDLAMASSRYQIAINGKMYSVSGTSAATPVFAGLVSLVNSYRLAMKLPPLGYLTPSIYSNNGGYARDVTSGNNKCTSLSSRCCAYGFYSAPGWDPLTGFGSVNFTKFLSYYLTTSSATNFAGSVSSFPSLIPSSYPTYSPTNKPTYIPSKYPTKYPTFTPTNSPTSGLPTALPSYYPTLIPTKTPTVYPTDFPSFQPSDLPTEIPTVNPTDEPTYFPSQLPTNFPSSSPTNTPTTIPTFKPTNNPSTKPT
eukprot:gene18025-23666_t